MVFTYFKDTARHLYRQLREDERFLRMWGWDKEQLRIVDSLIKPEERRDVIERFSPISNERVDVKDTDKEIHLLISTDVLSEGQNLQDADTVINYDLHWNPVRMIQRAGRIDRIGSPCDVVHVYNFFPEDELESLLGLMQRLYQKLEDINRTVGLDAPILGERVDPKDFNALLRVEQEDPTVLDELEQLSELKVGEFLLRELLSFLKEAGEERIKRIPWGVGSGMHKEGERGLFVSLNDGTRTFWAYSDLPTGTLTERKLEIIQRIRCAKETPRVDPDFDTYEVIEKVKQHVVKRLRLAMVKLPTLKSPQNQVVNWLQAVSSRSESPSIREEDLQLVCYLALV